MEDLHAEVERNEAVLSALDSWTEGLSGSGKSQNERSSGASFVASGPWLCNLVLIQRKTTFAVFGILFSTFSFGFGVGPYCAGIFHVAIRRYKFLVRRNKFSTLTLLIVMMAHDSDMVSSDVCFAQGSSDFIETVKL